MAAPMSLLEIVTRVVDDAMVTEESRQKLAYLLDPVNKELIANGQPPIDVNRPRL